MMSNYVEILRQVYSNNKYKLVYSFAPIFFEAKLCSIIKTVVPLSAQMPFANASKATQNGITAAIGASLQTSLLRTKKNACTPKKERINHFHKPVNSI